MCPAPVGASGCAPAFARGRKSQQLCCLPARSPSSLASLPQQQIAPAPAPLLLLSHVSFFLCCSSLNFSLSWSPLCRSPTHTTGSSLQARLCSTSRPRCRCRTSPVRSAAVLRSLPSFGSFLLLCPSLPLSPRFSLSLFLLTGNAQGYGQEPVSLWSSATGRIRCPEGRIRPSPNALARIPSSQPTTASLSRPGAPEAPAEMASAANLHP